MDEPNANLDEIGESVLAQAVCALKKMGSSIIITTHRPRLVSVVDKLLVLRAGQQVGFGPADEMINAVRNLQVVTPADPKGQSGPAEEAQVKNEGTNDAPSPSSTPPNFSRPVSGSPQPSGNNSGSINQAGSTTPDSAS